MKVAGEDSGLFAGFKHNGTGAVTKQHTGGAVIPVKDAGKDLRPNHQRFFAGPGANELFSGGQGIHKTTANGLDVKRRATLNTEPGLQNTGTAGEHFVWCGGSNNNEVDILSADTGSVDCPPCRLLRQVHRGLAGQGDVTLLMPVRSRIHWSEVSTRCSRSLLVTMFSGRYEPVPAMRAKVIRLVHSQGQ